MAAVSITAANVVKSTGAITEDGTAGEVITAGQAVYKKASDGKFYLADTLAASVAGNSEIDNFYGIALNGAPAAAQPLTVQKSGIITIGGTVAVGAMYYVGIAAGAISPVADIESPNYVTVIGLALTAGTININPYVSGIVKA